MLQMIKFELKRFYLYFCELFFKKFFFNQKKSYKITKIA